jgi:hypothetical protein
LRRKGELALEERAHYKGAFAEEEGCTTELELGENSKEGTHISRRVGLTFQVFFFLLNLTQVCCRKLVFFVVIIL